MKLKESKIKLDLLSIGNDLIALESKVLLAQGNYSESSEEHLDLREIYKRLDLAQEVISRKLGRVGN